MLVLSFLLRLHIAPQYRAHARLIALAGALEEADHLGVEAQSDLLFGLRQKHRRVVPEAGREHARVRIGGGASLYFRVAHILERLAQGLGRRHIVQTLIPDDLAAPFCTFRGHSGLPSTLR